jgi:hypothetical protein
MPENASISFQLSEQQKTEVVSLPSVMVVVAKKEVRHPDITASIEKMVSLYRWESSRMTRPQQSTATVQE